LAQYAERLPFVPWQPPAAECFALRAFARRLTALTEEKARTKNQLHALCATVETPRALIQDAKRAIAQLEKRIDQLTAHALKLINAHDTLHSALTLITSVCGIAHTSAISLLGELLVLPPGLSNKQWVAHAGLDPRENQSGTSVHKTPRLSKMGNRYIRRALYMPALCAAQRDPYVKAFYQHLIVNGKKPLQALCAVQRKLLHAIHGMLRDQKPFDNTRFFAHAFA
jgi:transposase